ncbi:HNH endonuclease [Elizabethkingia miricola]|uniref:HNH endonuclease n=1 Tax=Elizabethkingia miricola TaxID=172045 RepID=UPI003892919B
MKNLKHFKEDCFDVYREAVNNKKNVVEKKILVSIENKIESQFTTYSTKFLEKKIYEITSEIFSTQEKETLIDLYQSKSKVIKKIKNKILDAQIRTINTTCQYCTLNSVNTLDHFIPKESFPEFSVNPLNLFPCCPECNSKKSNICFIGDESQFLNLYLDELPEKKYLKVKFDFNDDIPLITFSLCNPDNIDESLYKIICNHYRRLNLLERMRERSREIITELIRTIKTYYSLNPNIEKVIQVIKDEEKENKEAYGYNYWKSALRLSLIEYDFFWNTYIK